jgi:hypothetical protein
MAASFLDTFRVLSSFSPERASLKGAPWEAFVPWALGNGLAPLAAYNLEYRLAGAGAPDWVREQLLAIYQGSVNDNVMKLVAFKRAVDALEGRKLVLLGGAPFAEGLYPHVGFRPVLEVQVLLRAMDVEPFANYLAQHQFSPASPRMLEDLPGATQVLSDDHTPVALYSALLGPKHKVDEAGLFARALPMKVYGPSMYRLDLEDALLAACLEQARAGYETPLLTFVDLRELLLGAPSLGGPYSRPCNTALLRERAQAFRLERALYVSLSVVGQLFPQTREQVAEALPALRPATRRLLDRALVAPLSEVGQVRTLRGLSRWRRLLSGR